MSTYYQTGNGLNPYGSSKDTGDVVVPSCTIEDVDRALFNLFDKDLDLYFEDDGKNSKRIPVVFATGERFAILRRKKPLRDKAGALILPLVSILRSGISQNATRGAGTNQNADIVIKKKLSPKDAEYQRIVNKEGLQNQDDRADNSHKLNPKGSGTAPGEIARRSADTEISQDFQSGRLLSNKVNNNIYEVYTVRAPKYFTATYDVTIWAQYMQQMNRVLTAILSSYHSQSTRSFRVETDKGYYFTAFFGENLGSELNFTDFSDQERIIKYTMTVEVTGYIINPEFPGGESTVRKYTSAPQISFDMVQVNAMPVPIKTEGIPSEDPNQYILEDLRTLDEPQPSSVIGGKAVTENPEFYKTTSVGGTEAGRDPLRVKRVYTDKITGKTVSQDLPIKSRIARKGETVYKEQLTFDLGEIVLTPK